MGLISCKECGKQISSKAASCPHCGVTVAGTRRSQVEGGDAVWLLVSCIVGLFLGVSLSRIPNEDNVSARVGLGILGLVAPPVGVLIWSGRRK